MQPGTVGAKAGRFIELEATIPQCVDNAIKAVAVRSAVTLAHYASLVGLDLDADNGTAAADFDERMSGNTFPQHLRKRDRINRNFRGRERSECKFLVELGRFLRCRPAS